MQPGFHFGLLLALLILGVVPADAQICAGRASFNLASTHFDADAALNTEGHGLSIAVGHGTDALFGIVSGATHTVDGADRVKMFAGTIGTDQPLSPDNKLHVCPMVTVGYASDEGGTTDRGARAGISAAGDIAMLVVNTPQLRVMPTIGIDLRYNGVGRSVGLFAHGASRRYRTFSAGIGFVIWNRLTLVPRLVIPFGPVDRGGVQVTVGYNLQRR